MSIISSLRRDFSILIASASVCVSAAGAQAARPCSVKPKIDLRAGTFAGVPIDSSIGYLRTHSGPVVIKRIERKNAEGERWVEVSFTVCGHRLTRMDHGVWWKDSAIRTAEGLGIGSRVSAFDSVYGRGEITREERTSIHYASVAMGVAFWVDVADRCYKYLDDGARVEVDRTCRATVMTALP